MVMRKIVLLIVAVVVIGGGGYYWMSIGKNKVTGDVKAGIDQALQKLPPGWAVTYKSLDLGVVAQQAVMKGVEVHGTGATKLDATIDEVDVTGPAFDFGKAWSDAAANPAAVAPDKALPVADAIAFKGVTVHLDGQDIKLGSAQIAKPRVYPWALLHAGVPGYNEVMAQIQHPAADPKPEDMLPLLRFEASYVLGVGYDSYDFEDISGTTKIAMPDAAATQAAFVLKKIAGASVDRGKMATAAMDGMSFKAGPQGDVTVDHVGITGLDAQNVLTQALSATTVDPSMVDGLTLGKLEYAGMTVKMPDEPPVTIGSIAVSNIVFAHSLLVSGEFSVAGFKITKALMTDEQALDAFNKLGLDVATLSFGAGYKWDVDKKTAVLKEASFKIDELGALTLSADLGGIEKPETMEQTATLNHAVLRYNDASFAGKALKIAATESGADPAGFGQQMAAMVQAQGAMIGKSPGIAAATKAIGTFLTDPHNLTIELTPPQPLAMATLDDDKDLPPEQIFNKLGVKVTANQ
jgi:hypothetical protein